MSLQPNVVGHKNMSITIALRVMVMLLLFPSSSFTFLLGNYAIVKISEDDISSLAAFPQVIYIERPRQLIF
jgi:hypothetical protein